MISTPGGGTYHPVAKESKPLGRQCSCLQGYCRSVGRGLQAWGTRVESADGHVKGLFGSSRIANSGDPHEGDGGHIKGWGFRTCSCPHGYFASALSKVEHWGDPHENLNGFALAADATGHPLERFDCDEAGKPLFLTPEGLPTSAKSATGPIRWMAPEALWEPELEMFLEPDAVYSPHLGMTVAAAKFPAGKPQAGAQKPSFASK